jgi:hypothetical protein
MDMEQIEKYIKESSRHDLDKKLKDLVANGSNLGKTLPTLENEAKIEIYLREFNDILAELKLIREEITNRDLQKISTPSTTMERLLPTVTKYIQDRKPPIIEEETKSEEKVLEEQQAVIKAKMKTESNKIEPTTNIYNDETDVLRATDMAQFFSNKPEITPMPHPEEAFKEIDTKEPEVKHEELPKNEPEKTVVPSFADLGIEDMM